MAQLGRQAYESYRPQRRTQEMLRQINLIADEYIDLGRNLTVRQLHYQFVARGWGPNTQANYELLQRTIRNARLGGMLTWDVIVDRTRHVREESTWDSPGEIVEAVARQYRMDHWASQPNRVEVRIEKDALGGIVEEAVEDMGTPWFSMRGFPSVTSLREAAERRILPNARAGQHTTILLLTDHDPSGLMMNRTVAADLARFAPPAAPEPGSFDGQSPSNRAADRLDPRADRSAPAAAKLRQRG